MMEPEREKNLPGYAIGGLSGGEEKSVFWRIISQCAQRLPENKPRYSMGIGYGEDLLVCAALGVDMADCVFPTRTAVRHLPFSSPSSPDYTDSSSRDLALRRSSNFQRSRQPTSNFDVVRFQRHRPYMSLCDLSRGSRHLQI